MKKLLVILIALIVLSGCATPAAHSSGVVVVLRMLDGNLYQIAATSVADANRMLRLLESPDDQKTVVIANGDELLFVVSLRNLEFAYMTTT